MSGFRRSVQASPLLAVVSGLFLTVLFLGIMSLFFLWKSYDPNVQTIGRILSVAPVTLVLIGAVGALGSVVSIMTRIRAIDFVAYIGTPDPWPFFFALFKPIVGATFALFVYAAINSGLLPLDATDDGWLYVAVAFIAGFSERFAKDIVSNAENSLPGSIQGGRTVVIESPQSNGAPQGDANGHKVSSESARRNEEENSVVPEPNREDKDEKGEHAK